MNEPVAVTQWLFAVAPLALLLALVASGRFKTHVAAGVVVATAVTVAATRFGAGVDVLAVATGKGLWLGLWISCVVAPALLLYRVAEQAGLDRIGSLLDALTTDRLQHLLIVAWLAPSLVQGIAGFGAPIALTAPLLVSMGYGVVKAVAYPLIGYCWSVTFGSMGSSFYMAAVSGHLDPADTTRLALTSGVVLAAVSLAGALTLCLLEGGLGGLLGTLPFVLAVGAVVGAVLIGTAVVVPAVASTAAAGAGLAAATVWGRVVRRRRHRSAPVAQPAARQYAVLAPYALLLAVVLPVFLVPASGRWIRDHLALALDFPATRTATGWVNDAAADYTPIYLLAHPGTYVLLSTALGYLVYRRLGLWGPTPIGTVLNRWVRAVPAAVAPIFILTWLAGVLTETGMTSTVAVGLVAALGLGYPLVAPLVGAAGSFVTGSTTSSNALLSGLQADAADLLDVPRSSVLAAQTAGGNVGNSLAPVVVAVGASTVQAGRHARDIIRTTLPAAVAFLVLVTALTAAVTYIGH